MAHGSFIPTARDETESPAAERLTSPFIRFANLSSSGGILLIIATAAALIWANFISADSYNKLFYGTAFKASVLEYDHHHHAEDDAHATEGTGGHADDPDAVTPSEETTDNSHSGSNRDAHARADDPAPRLLATNAGAAAPDPASTTGAPESTHDSHAKDAKKSDYWNLKFSLNHWINDLFMAVFFLLVGLEIKREILVGELASVRRAALPIAAAIGGMLIPALFFFAFNNADAAAVRGWGVPMATDIAFALGILALLGSRIPNSLKVFLASLAIVDDLGALLVIAIFYTESLDWNAMGTAGLLLGLLVCCNMLKVRWLPMYIAIGVPMWYFTYQSGVHATIAGVVLAMTIPATARVDPRAFLSSTKKALHTFEDARDDENDIRRNATQRIAAGAVSDNAQHVLPPLHRLEHGLHPWVAFLILPVFALANAGLEIQGGVSDIVSSSVSMGVICGLFLGKPLGVLIFSFIAVKLGVAALPTGVSWRHLLGTGFLAGIGFTMALFIANLAYAGAAENLADAKLGILIASAISAVAGAVILLSCKSGPEPNPDSLGPIVDEEAVI